MSKLVVLDLNGVLVDKKGHRIHVRPGAKNFIEHLAKKYTVCVWSAAMTHNIQRILNKILLDKTMFEKKKENPISFILSQENCDPVQVSGSRVPLFMKNINVIHLLYPDKFDKILFIDNTIEKLSNNPKGSYYIVDTWTRNSQQVLSLKEIELAITQLLS